MTRAAIPPELRKLKLDILSDLDEVEKQIVLKENLTGNIHHLFAVQTEGMKNKKNRKSQKF